MEFRLSAEQELFRRMVREFCEKRIEPVAREIDDSEKPAPHSLIKEIAAQGILGVTIPEEYGGSASPGEEMVYAALAVHELARGDISMAIPVYCLLNIGWGLVLVKHGTEEARRELLPRIASGEQFLGICTTEPGGGSDLANIKTVAQKKGDKFVINGEKIYISGVQEALERGGGHLTLFRTDPEAGHRGMTFAYVPINSPGISTTLFRDMGRMGLSTGGMVYKDVEIPEKYIMGEVNRGFYHNMEGFNAARTLVAAACLGGAEKVLEIGKEYVKQRVLFGRPLSKFEGISFEIAEDYGQLEMLKLMVLKAAWMIDRYYQDKSFTGREINTVVSICKLGAPALALEVAKHGMMYHGAFGFTKDCPIEMNMRSVMAYMVGAEGGANIMKLIIARDYIGDEAVPYR